MIKYPRTFHLIESPGKASDDKTIKSMSDLYGFDVVITEKMDGENTSIYSNAVTARSLDTGYHESRTWVKQFASTWQHELPPNFRVCGENLYAKHSIGYENLASFFYGFSVWENETCLSWDDTLEFFELFGIVPVRTLYRGILSQKIIGDLINNVDTAKMEGFVIRRADSFELSEFNTKVAKWVRAGHVATDQHWMHCEIIKNAMSR